MKIHGGAPKGFIDFSAPSNPLGVPPPLLSLLKEALNEIDRYPNPSYHELVEAIRDFYGLQDLEVIPLNGAAEAYSLIPLALKAKTIISIDPTFGDLDDVTIVCGAHRVSVCMEARGEEWVFVRERAIEKLKDIAKPCVAFISVPNNPTGSLDSLNAIEILRDLGCVVIVDYAFIDLALAEVPIVVDEGVVALFSLTKSLAVPGLRIGFLATVKGDVVAKLIELARQPWNVNAVAAYSISRLLTDFGDYIRRFLDLAKRVAMESYAYISKELTKLGFEVFKTFAPYVLVKHERMESLARCLEKFKIAVRLCSSFKCLSNEYARISLKPLNEMELLVEALRRCLG